MLLCIRNFWKPTLLTVAAAIFLSAAWQKRGTISDYLRYLEVIDITPVLYDGEQVMASEIFSDFRYIELEANEESMIRSIQDIVVHNGNIFILESSGKVLRFDETGCFLNRIGSTGRGPGEFSQTNINLNILRDQNQIAVTDHTLKKVNIFEFDGKHVTSFTVGCYPLYVASVNNHLLSYTGWLHAQFSNNYAISVTTLKGKPSGSLLPVERFIPRGMAILWSHIADGYYYFRDSLSLRDANVDTIYRIVNKDRIFPRYYLSAGKKHLTWEKRYNTGDPDRTIRKNSVYFNGFVETAGHIFLGARVIDVPGYFLYDKAKKAVRNISPPSGPGGIASIRGFTNDIDGGIPFWPAGYYSDKELLAYFEPRFLRGHFRNIAILPQKHSYNSKKHLSLKERIEKSDINSNPWLMLAKLK